MILYYLFIYFFKLNVLYVVLAFLSFYYIKPSKPINQYKKPIDYYIYHIEYICLIFSIFTIISTIFCKFDSDSIKYLVTVPLTHFVCDSVLFLIVSRRIKTIKKNDDNNDKMKIERKKSNNFFMQIFDDPLQTLHHIAMISLYLIVLFIGNNNTFIIFFIFLDEISVPFLLIKKQLQKNNIFNGLIFSLNENAFIFLYLITRGFILPFLFYKNLNQLNFFIAILFGFLLWINYFWIFQVLDLLARKNMLNYLTKLIEIYKNSQRIKIKIHGFLFLILIIFPIYKLIK